MPAPEAQPEKHYMEEHNPHMETAKKLDDVTAKEGRGSEVPAPDAHPEGHQKKDHNPNMEISEKLDAVQYKLWDVLALADDPSLRGICFEVIDNVEEFSENIKKDQKLNRQVMMAKTHSSLNRIRDLKPTLKYCAEGKDANVQQM